MTRKSALIVLLGLTFLSVSISLILWKFTQSTVASTHLLQAVVSLWQSQTGGRWILIGIILLLPVLIWSIYHSRSRWRFWLIIALVVYCLGFTALGYWRHLNLQTSLFDFGLEQQVIWNTSEGRLFASSVEVDNYLGDHFSPFLAVPAAIYHFFPSALTIFFLQALALTLTIAPLALLARRLLVTHPALGIQSTSPGLRSIIAILLSSAFALHWGITSILNFDYHPIAFALPFLAWGMYSALLASERKSQRLHWLASGLFILAMCCKEDVGIWVASFGLVRALFARDRWGWAWIALGVIFTVVPMFVIIPWLRNAPSDTLERYGALGSNGDEILRTLLTRPLYVADYLISYSRFAYLAKLGLPFLFVFVWRPRYYLLFLPALAVNILSSEAQHSGTVHYDGLVLLGLWLASLLTIHDFLVARPLRAHPGASLWARIHWAWPILWTLTLAVYFVISPFWLSVFGQPQRVDAQQQFQSWLQTIPRDSKLWVGNGIGGQLGEFANVQLYHPSWPRTIQQYANPDFIIVDTIRDADVILALLGPDRARGYQEVYSYGGVLALARTNAE